MRLVCRRGHSRCSGCGCTLDKLRAVQVVGVHCLYTEGRTEEGSTAYLRGAGASQVLCIWSGTCRAGLHNCTCSNIALQRLQNGLVSLKTNMEQLPETIKAMVSWSYIQVFQPILNASEGKRMCWAIGAVNCAVFLAWRVPRWGAFMMRSFTHNPLSGRSYTLLTSTFR